MCLVNNAVYIAKYKDGEHPGEWTATGTQFAVPYVYKTLFSKEPIVFEDMCETKSVTSCIYLDLNENLPEGEHDYKFVGKIGQFCPIKPGHGGGLLVRSATDKEGNIKYDSVVGTKDYRWLESERIKAYGSEEDIDRTYYQKLVDDAVDSISQYGDFEWFVSDDPVPEIDDNLPWKRACGKDTCVGCPYFTYNNTDIDCKLGYDVSDLMPLNESDDAFIKR